MVKIKFFQKKYFFILFPVIIVTVGCFFLINYISKLPRGKEGFTKIQLKEEIITFVFEMLPDVYSGIVRINDQIVIIEKETDRLNKISSEFPQQKKIVDSEIAIWNKTKKDLETSLSLIEKGIEPLYVAFLVNKEKGQEQIKGKTEELKKVVTDVLDLTKEVTKKLNFNEKKGIFNKVKQLFNKKNS